MWVILCNPEPRKSNGNNPTKFTISKETTFVTGPVDKDGYIDFAAALNERLGKGVTAENNANVLIWKAIVCANNGANPVLQAPMGMTESSLEQGGTILLCSQCSGRCHDRRESKAYMNPGEKIAGILATMGRLRIFRTLKHG